MATPFPINTYSPNNLYISSNTEGGSDTYLTMRTHRPSDFQTSAEFDSRELVDHASVRMYSRAFGDSGACAALFTYLENTNAALVQESDVEILTKDRTSFIHHNNQPAWLDDKVPGAENDVSLPVPGARTD